MLFSLDPARWSTWPRRRKPLKVASVVLISVVYGWLALVPELEKHDRWTSRWALLYVAQPSCVMSLLLMALVTGIDPGLVKRGWPHGAEPAACSPCPVCDVIRPPGTHHCRECKVCVAGHDHHCGVLGVCIGAGNQRCFIALLAAGFVPWVLLGWAGCIGEWDRLGEDMSAAPLWIKWNLVPGTVWGVIGALLGWFGIIETWLLSTGNTLARMQQGGVVSRHMRSRRVASGHAAMAMAHAPALARWLEYFLSELHAVWGGTPLRASVCTSVQPHGSPEWRDETGRARRAARGRRALIRLAFLLPHLLLQATYAHAVFDGLLRAAILGGCVLITSLSALLLSRGCPVWAAPHETGLLGLFAKPAALIFDALLGRPPTPMPRRSSEGSWEPALSTKPVGCNECKREAPPLSTHCDDCALCIPGYDRRGDTNLPSCPSHLTPRSPGTTTTAASSAPASATTTGAPSSRSSASPCAPLRPPGCAKPASSSASSRP